LRNPKPFPNYYGNVLGVGGIPNPSHTLPKKTLSKHDSIPIMSSEILPKAVWERFGRRRNPKSFPKHSLVTVGITFSKKEGRLHSTILRSLSEVISYIPSQKLLKHFQ